MDAKALAKSKRAHSQQHSKKPHQSQHPKPPLTATGDAISVKKQTGKQIREKTRQAQRVSALPSNRDRYEEEFDSASEDQATDAIVPKSKGADYRHLIAEAESQSQLQLNPYSDGFPSLDDFLPGDFNQFIGSMLSVRGEGILSRIGNDNFVVEDRTSATPEASFLSLNLHTLAEQLEKVDVSERLFIEEDLLPPALVERSKLNNNQKSDQMQTTSEGNTTAFITEELTPNVSPEKVNIAVQNVHSSFGSGRNFADATLANGGLDFANESYDLVSNQHGKSGETRMLQSSTQDNSTPVAVSNKNVTTVEVAAAEAELDELLNSFSETKPLDSSDIKPKTASSDFSRGSSSLPQLASKGVDSSTSAAITSSVDDLLDDLLQETSTMVNRGFDLSNSTAITPTSDDILDDLLKETSSTVDQNDLSRHMDVKGAAPDSIQSSSHSHSVSKSKVLNDFDSWLDTI